MDRSSTAAPASPGAIPPPRTSLPVAPSLLERWNASASTSRPSSLVPDGRLRLDARWAMSGTRRIPLARLPAAQVTERAVELFVAMSRLKCTCPPPSPTRSPCPGCERWYDFNGELHVELGCKPWEWPCVARQTPKRAGSPCWNEDIAARMAILDEAVRRRTEKSGPARGPSRESTVRAETQRVWSPHTEAHRPCHRLRFASPIANCNSCLMLPARFLSIAATNSCRRLE
jgi:hypothetical protein